MLTLQCHVCWARQAIVLVEKGDAGAVTTSDPIYYEP